MRTEEGEAVDVGTAGVILCILDQARGRLRMRRRSPGQGEKEFVVSEAQSLMRRQSRFSLDLRGFEMNGAAHGALALAALGSGELHVPQ